MDALYTFLHSDILTGVQYALFAFGIVGAQLFQAFQDGLVSRSAWLFAGAMISLSLVFVACSATGYISDHIGHLPPGTWWEDPAHAALNVFTAALNALSWHTRIFYTAFTAVTRAEMAEARAVTVEADAAERSREQARLVMEYAEEIGAPMAAYDLETDRYLAMNRAGRLVYGDGNPDGPPGLYEKPYYSFLAPGELEKAAAVAESRRAAIEAGEPDPGYKGLRLMLGNGRTVEFHQEERPGALVGILVFWDVTGELDAEAEVRRLQSDVQAARDESAEARKQYLLRRASEHEPEAGDSLGDS